MVFQRRTPVTLTDADPLVWFESEARRGAERPKKPGRLAGTVDTHAWCFLLSFVVCGQYSISSASSKSMVAISPVSCQTAALSGNGFAS